MQYRNAPRKHYCRYHEMSLDINHTAHLKRARMDEGCLYSRVRFTVKDETCLPGKEMRFKSV